LSELLQLVVHPKMPPGSIDEVTVPVYVTVTISAAAADVRPTTANPDKPITAMSVPFISPPFDSPASTFNYQESEQLPGKFGRKKI